MLGCRPGQGVQWRGRGAVGALYMRACACAWLTRARPRPNAIRNAQDGWPVAVPREALRYADEVRGAMMALAFSYDEVMPEGGELRRQAPHPHRAKCMPYA